MNDFYGIDPKAPSNLSELSGLIRLFSPSEGRFIADFPMGWANELREHMSSLSDLCRMATVETWIQLSGYAILPTKKLYRSNLTWAENASFLKSDVVKLIDPTGKISNTVEPLDHILSEPNAFRDSRAGLIPRTSSAYAEIARPILLRSRKVVLIDPFLTFRHIPDNSNQWKYDRRRTVIEAMLKIAFQGKYVECFEIFYVPENNIYGSDFLDEDLKELVRQIGFTKIHVAAKPIKKETNTKQHTRYLLGLKSGLHFDHGFDTYDDGSKNHIQWMSPSVLDPLLEKFT